MTKKTVVVSSQEGLDARPIAMVVQEAGNFTSQIYIEMGNKKINAKSIMGMMSLCLTCGQEITVVTDGADEVEAASKMSEYIAGLCS